ncbi:MAG: DUF4910 domain-containing protein [Oceanicaulis sp.]
MQPYDSGETMHGWARDLFAVPRSLTGPGVRATLDYLAGLLPGLQRHAVASGTAAFDWTAPDEWTVREAYIETPGGERICRFADDPLHLMGYSHAVNAELDLADLQAHLYSRPDLPEAIPYVTSYYARNWGFCLKHSERKALEPGRYKVVIDADLQPGRLDYADLVLPGRTSREILISTYICHPSMANNELSGPVVAAALARWWAGAPRTHTARFVFVPETIGSIVYLSRHLEHLRRHLAAGFVLSCIGDERAYSMVQTARADTLADRAARLALASLSEAPVLYSYLHRGSDERQYASPGAGLPVVSLSRSKYGAYPEYHTSLDDLENVVTPDGLAGGFELARRAVSAVEANKVWRPVFPCEPQMGKRGLYGQISTGRLETSHANRMHFLAYCDGRDFIDVCTATGLSPSEGAAIADQLHAAELITATPDP